MTVQRIKKCGSSYLSFMLLEVFTISFTSRLLYSINQTLKNKPTPQSSFSVFILIVTIETEEWLERLRGTRVSEVTALMLVYLFYVCFKL